MISFIITHKAGITTLVDHETRAQIQARGLQMMSKWYFAGANDISARKNSANEFECDMVRKESFPKQKSKLLIRIEEDSRSNYEIVIFNVSTLVNNSCYICIAKDE